MLRAARLAPATVVAHLERSAKNRVRILKKLFGRHDGGETSEFTAFVDGSVEGLQLATAAHQGAWHFGDEERWDIRALLLQLMQDYVDGKIRPSTNPPPRPDEL